MATGNADSKPSARVYWAIRHCDSLQAPAIFASWDDCSFYIDQSENDDAVEYKRCLTLQEAAAYIESPRGSLIQEQKNRKRAAEAIEIVASVCGEESTSAKRVKRAEQKYEASFKLLQEYKKEHGTCDIPTNHVTIQNNKYEKLDKWILKMRKEIRLFQKKDPTSELDQEKVNQLLELGFAMKPQRAKEEKRRATLESSWDEMLNQLKEYVRLNGNAHVPETRHRNPLYLWTVKLREEYAKMKENKQNILTRERMDQLAGLGFDLAPPRKRKPFEERAHEWLEFRTKHGREPKRETEEEPLAIWATKTRMKYELYKKGEKTNLTKEQVELLTRWGFKWVTDSKFAPTTRTSEYKTWEERFEELVAYKEEHGDCLVPQSYPHLGSWVKRQRKEYQKLKKNIKSRLTKLKLKKLKQVGFVFEVRKRASPAVASQNVLEESETESEEEETEDIGDYPAPKRGYSPPQRGYAAPQHYVANAMASMRNGFDHW